MSDVKKYMKKPTVLEAIQISWDAWDEMCDFLGDLNPALLMDAELKEVEFNFFSRDNVAQVFKDGDYIVKDGKYCYGMEKELFEFENTCIEYLYNPGQGKPVLRLTNDFTDDFVEEEIKVKRLYSPPGCAPANTVLKSRHE
jgi:hypothetical protein